MKLSSFYWHGPAGRKVNSQPLQTRTLQTVWQVSIQHSWQELCQPGKAVVWVLCALASQKCLNFG